MVFLFARLLLFQKPIQLKRFKKQFADHPGKCALVLVGNRLDDVFCFGGNPGGNDDLFLHESTMSHSDCHYNGKLWRAARYDMSQ